MATIGFCNICLITGVKMEMLEATDIKRFIDTNGLPLLACYECATLVGKVNILLNKYHIARTILENMLQTQDQITEEELKSIDRKSLMLESNLECCTQPLIISFHTKPDRDLAVQSNNHHQSKKGGEQEEKFSIIEKFEDYRESNIGDEQEEISSITEEFEDETVIDNLINECEETEKLEADTDKKKVSDSPDSNGLNNQMKNIIDNECNDLLQMLDNCDDNDALLEEVDLIVEKLNNDVDKIMKKRRKTNVPRSTKKGPQPKFDLLECLFDITELTRSEQIKEFSKRKESVKFLNSTYKCELCFRGFKYLTTYETHVKLCHDPGLGSSKCPVCNIIKKNDVKVNEHITTHHRRIYKCKKCHFISTMRSTVDRHKKWHDGAVYNCRFCGESFDKNMTKLSHERLKHPSEFLCDLCGLPFVSTHGIRAHKRMAHFDHKESTEEADPQLYCEECKIQFATSNAWETHLQKSIKHNPHKQTVGTPTPQPWKPVCRYCGLECKDREELGSHQLAKHCKLFEAVRSSNGRKTFRPVPRQGQQYPTQCNYCDAVVTGKRQHYNHHTSLHFNKPYKKGDFVCETCGKTFMTQGTLTLHVQAKHEPGTRFECDHCHANFSSKMCLKAHMQRHLYPVNLCSNCGKVFKSKGSLKIHVRNAHGGPRPHECRFCQKTFVLGSLLKVHVNEVHLGLAKKRIRTRKKANS